MTDLQSLSDREIEILELLTTGKRNKEIARELHISTNTVKVHVRNIFGKLEVASRTEASMVAVRHGLIDTSAPEEGESQDEQERPAAGSAAPSTAPVPAPAVTPRPGPNTQTWILAGILVSVTLLSVIAYRLFNPEAEATVPPDSFTVESQWQDAPNLPAPRTRAASVSLENVIYVIGGLVDGAPSATVLRMDPEVGDWMELAEKPTPVSEIQAAVLGGLVYVPGGLLSSGDPSAGLEIYDPRLDTWSSGPDMPTALSAYALAAHEGKLYLFGGRDAGGFTDHTFVFDPDSGDWRELTPLPAALGFAGAAAIGSRIYVIGGYDGATAQDSTYVYTPSLDGASDPWETAAAIPEGRYGMALVSVADKIHLIGGLGGRGEFFSQMDYIPQSNLWQVVENPLAGEWTYPAGAALGTEIYVLGGEIDGAPTNRSLTYQVLFIVVIPVVPNR